MTSEQQLADVLPIMAAGVTLIGPDSDPHYAAASAESALRFAELQTDLGEGPADDIDAWLTESATRRAPPLPVHHGGVRQVMRA